jgi:hypothetical protein
MRWTLIVMGLALASALAGWSHHLAGIDPTGAEAAAVDDRAQNSSMANLDVSCVTAANGWLCQVTIDDDGSESRHSVTLIRADFQRLTSSGGTPEDLVRRSVDFLLQREARDQILKSFALPDIGKYFPEYEAEIRKG